MGRVRKAALKVMVATLVLAVVLLVICVVYRHNQNLNTFNHSDGNLFGPLHLHRQVRS